MSYTIADLAFILYNNRSVNGVVKNFIPKDIDISLLNKIESEVDYYKNMFYNEKYVEVNRSDVDEKADDVYVNKDDISSLTEVVRQASLSIDGIELDYLNNRGIGKEIIDEWTIGGLSKITNYNDLVKLNATCHPVLSPILEDGIEGGGILIPLFKEGILINCAIRKISDIGKLKYSLACPDIDIWGLDDVNNEEIYITEGLFDMMALRSIGLKAVSVSSAMWSGIQLYKLIKSNPKSIIIFCDDDHVGLRTGFILNKFFNINGIRNKCVISDGFKDASEQIFLNKKGVDFIKDIQISKKDINNREQNFNFLDYLKNRSF